MNRLLLQLLLCMLVGHTTGAQELFPLMEPASNTPAKGVMGVRVLGETYNEINRLRNLAGLKISYGLTSHLTIDATATVSNHHSRLLPPEFPDHNTPQIGVSLPYRFNGFDFYAKYRVLSIDRANSHFRTALYGEYSLLNVAHDEAEPRLLDDTKGVGGGLIATYLKNRFAVSFTGGVILPSVYTGFVPDVISSLPSVPAKINYGNGYNYDLSLGYLLFPSEYKSYNQTNWNVYMEFLGKTYTAAQMQVGNVIYQGPLYTINTRNNHALQAGHYIELYPGLQCIIKSNTRIDLSVGYPVMGKSYEHFYPVYNFGMQRYFYFNNKSHKRRSGRA